MSEQVNLQDIALGDSAKVAIPLHVFHSHVKSMNYIFPNGFKAEFINGRFYTDNEEYADHLKSEIRKGLSTIFQVRGQEKLMSDDLDPINVLRKQHRLEMMQELLNLGLITATGQSPDTGKSEQGKLNAQSTTDLAAVAAGGDGKSLGVRLAQLNAGAIQPQ